MSSSQTDQTPSKVELIKAQSDGLAGDIAQILADPQVSHFDEDNLQLLKFHGSYQQDDRDLRIPRKRAGLDKAWMFMVRARIPGGQLSARQFLAMEELGRRYANGTLRLTSRQGIQYHGVGKENLKAMVAAINQEAELTTLGACGDVNRNVMCDPAARLDWRAGLAMHELCERIARHFEAQSSSYWEIWCDGERDGQPVPHNREEPIYGTHYMPRKFKMAVAVPENNSVQLYSQDIGIEVVHEGGRLLGYDLIVGGGMGSSHGNAATFPRLGTRLVRANPSEILEVVEAILTIQRDFGDRSDRKRARFKYLVEERGADWLRGELFRRLGRELAPAGPLPAYGNDDMVGWRETNDGRLMVGLHVLNGRLRSEGESSQLAGLRRIFEADLAEGAMITPLQDLVLTGIAPADRDAVAAILGEHGLSDGQNISRLRRLSMACVALPTCGLALAESERYLPTLVGELEALGDGDAPVQILMTGCPNACIRTPLGELALVGRGPGKYALSAGGSQQGTRLTFPVLEKVDDAQLAGIIHRLIGAWREETRQGVPFGDWAAAQGAEALRRLAGEGNQDSHEPLPNP